MKTLQEQYNQIKNGGGRKDLFLKEAKSTYPNLISNITSFKDAENILKNKSIINEELGGVVTLQPLVKLTSEDFNPNKQAWENKFEAFLAEEKLIIIVSYNLDTAENEGLQKLKVLSEKAQAKGYTVIGLSASGETAIANINATYDLNFEFYLCDEKALKTVVRSNPGVLELNQGTVQQKVHWNDIDNLDL